MSCYVPSVQLAKGLTESFGKLKLTCLTIFHTGICYWTDLTIFHTGICYWTVMMFSLNHQLIVIFLQIILQYACTAGMEPVNKIELAESLTHTLKEMGVLTTTPSNVSVVC